MRLYSYLSKISDDDVASFRTLSLNLVENNTGNIDLVKRVSDRFSLDDAALQLLEKANSELKSIYRGRMMFDFCADGEGINPENLNVNEQKIQKIKERWFRFNDDLASIQNKFEIKIRDGLHR